MDNVTHTLFALTLARTPLGRGRGTTAALVLASNAPDTDIVATLGGSANYLAWHRGPTHGPLGVVGLALLTAALVWIGYRIAHRRRGGVGAPAVAGVGRLAAVACVGVLSHILMDLPTSYGTRLFSPFDWRWFALDLMPIIDVYLLAILVGGLIIGRGSEQRGHKAAIVALALMATNYGIRIAAHQQALAVAGRTFGPRLPPPCNPDQAFRALVDAWPRPGTGGGGGDAPCLIETAAIPTFVSPFAWRVIAQRPDAYEVYDVHLWRSPGMPLQLPNQWNPAVAAAARTPSAQILLGFSRFPLARSFTGPGGSTVQFTDVRFEMGAENAQLQARRSAIFSVTVAFDAQGTIVEERFGD